MVKTGGRPGKHARYYWLFLAEGHLNRRRLGAMLGRIARPLLSRCTFLRREMILQRFHPGTGPREGLGHVIRNNVQLGFYPRLEYPYSFVRVACT
jgi:hypothetical protein